MDGQTIRVTRRRLLSGTTDWNLFGEEADEHLAQANSETVVDAAGISEDRAEEWITGAQSQAESATPETRSLTENDDLLFYDSGSGTGITFCFRFDVPKPRRARGDGRLGCFEWHAHRRTNGVCVENRTGSVGCLCRWL